MSVEHLNFNTVRIIIFYMWPWSSIYLWCRCWHNTNGLCTACLPVHG